MDTADIGLGRPGLTITITGDRASGRSRLLRAILPIVLDDPAVTVTVVEPGRAGMVLRSTRIRHKSPEDGDTHALEVRRRKPVPEPVWIGANRDA